MRIRENVCFHMEPEKAQEILDPLKLKWNTTDTLHCNWIFIDSKEYQILSETLTKMGVRFNGVIRQPVYSNEELASAKLLRMWCSARFGYPQPEDNENKYGKSFEEMTYDPTTKCPKCGNGAIQVNPFRTLKPRLGRNDVVALEWVDDEIFVTPRTKEIIQKSDLTGYEFLDVLNHKTNEVRDDITQVYITSTLPPLCPESIQESSAARCECGRRGFMRNTKTFELVYHSSVLDVAMDFNKSQEWLGGMQGTWRTIFVSDKVYRLFTEHNIRGVRFEAVKLI